MYVSDIILRSVGPLGIYLSIYIYIYIYISTPAARRPSRRGRGGRSGRSGRNRSRAGRGREGSQPRSRRLHAGSRHRRNRADSQRHLPAHPHLLRLLACSISPRGTDASAAAKKARPAAARYNGAAAPPSQSPRPSPPPVAHSSLLCPL